MVFGGRIETEILDVRRSSGFATSRCEALVVYSPLRLDRLRLRGPNGAHDEFLLAATAQNLRKLAKLIPMPSPHPA
jgi:hypothetical protein